MKTVKLWLDDVRPAPEGWVHAKSVKEAIEIMSTHRVEEMSLDHDLDVCPVCHPNVKKGDILPPCTCRESTGYDFVLWMAKNNNWPTTKPYVHSMNPAGAQAMRQTIERYFNAHSRG